MSTEDLKDCQKMRMRIASMFIAVLALLGGTLTKLMVDMAVVKEKVTSIERRMTGHLGGRYNRVARDINEKRD